jgi:hypothetical protein
VDGEAHFAVSLEDRVSGAAKSAKVSLDDMGSGFGHAKHGVEDFAGGLIKVHEPIESVRDGLKELRAGLNETVSALRSGEAKGVVEGLANALAGAASMLDAVVPGLGTVASAAIRAGGAVGGFFVGLTQTAVETALEVTEVNEKLVATFDALGAQGPTSGKATLEMLNQLSGPSGLPQARAQLADWTRQLEATGVTDLGELRTQIRATASAQAIMGDSGAAAYEKIREKVAIAVESHTPLKIATKGLTGLYKAGLNITDIADRMGVSTNKLAADLKAGTVDAQAFGNAMTESLLEKGRKPLDAMGNEMGTIKRKAGEIFGHLFDDIETGPLVQAVKGLIYLGDQSEPSGRALKMGLTGAVNSVISALGKAVVEGELFFLRTEALALEAYIAVKPLIHAFETVAGYAGKVGDFLSGPAKPEFSLEQPSRAEQVGGAVGSTATAATVGGLVGSAFGVSAVGEAGGTLLVGTYELLKNMADDTARGIARESGVTLGKETIAGIKEGTETHSPSKAAIRIGMSLGEGMGMGMTSSPEPQRAARTVSSRALGGLASGAGAAGGIFGGGGIRIDHLELHITAPSGVTDATAVTAMSLAVALERYQLASGR